jgi:hypothetical protein
MVTFGLTLQLCALAAVAAAILAWYPPAPGEALWDLPAGWLPAVPYVAGPPPAPVRVPVAQLDLSQLPADEREHLSEGDGSLTSVLQTLDDPTLMSDRERQAVIDGWVYTPVDVPPLKWTETDAALERFLAPLSPVERLHVAADTAATVDPVVVASWRTAGTLEHTGEIHMPRELIGARA